MSGRDVGQKGEPRQETRPTPINAHVLTDRTLFRRKRTTQRPGGAVRLLAGGENPAELGSWSQDTLSVSWPGTGGIGAVTRQIQAAHCLQQHGFYFSKIYLKGEKEFIHFP